PVKIPDTWAQVAKGVVEFEAALAQAATEALADQEGILRPVTELVHRTPSLDWSIIFGNAFPQGVQAPNGAIVDMPDYLNKLNAILENTPPKTLQNYFAWTLIRVYSDFLGQAYIGHSVPDRSAVCVEAISTNLADLVGHYFVTATFTQSTVTKLNEIVAGLREAYTENFKIYDWFDPITREGALQKIKAIIENDGYSMGIPNDGDLSSIDAYYSSLTITPTDYFGNRARSLTFLARNQFKLLNTVVNRKSMSNSPQNVNAYYLANMNDIDILAGIVQTPYFHIDNPEYLNYGGIGTVVGHEIGHGFDNNGRHYDATGRKRD
ncbi:hypothetical protein BGX26_008046, partial [Mortierella sp. AD094]